MASDSSIKFTGAAEFKTLSVKLRTAADGKALRRELREAIKSAMEPMKTAVQESVRSYPTHGTASTGLREAVARAVAVQVLTSSQPAVRLQILPSRMPSGQESLPALMDGSGRWRHPVFGHQKVWVSQASHPYFWRAVEPHIKDVRAAVQEAVARFAAKIEEL